MYPVLVCVCVFSLSSISRQPRRGAFQGFDEGLQQERPAHGEEWRHHSGGHQDDSHQPHLSGESSPGWSFHFNIRTGPTDVLKCLSSEWKGGGPDDKCLDRTGTSARTSPDGSVSCFAIIQCICRMLSNTAFLHFCMQQWCDYRLRWDQPPRSALYGNISKPLRIPSKSIWLPDIILENKWE